VKVQLHVNEALIERDVASDVTLVEFVRNDLELTGTHVACNNGICGSCTVLLDGEAVRSCLLLAVQVDGSNVTTIEGIASGANATRRLAPLQQAFIECGAVQCGFCIPGMIVTATALLRAAPRAAREDIVAALEGNLCRCTGYVKIVEAVAAAAITP